jgi:putative transposase
MRKSRFTEEQMVAKLREADRTSVVEVARKNKVTEQTLYSWSQKFAALEPASVKPLRELKTENARRFAQAHASVGDRARHGHPTPGGYPAKGP